MRARRLKLFLVASWLLAVYAVLAVMGVVSFCCMRAGVPRIPEVMIIYTEYCITLYDSTVVHLESENQAFSQYFLIFIVFFEYSYYEYPVFAQIFRILSDSYTTTPPHRYTKTPKALPPDMQKVSTRIIRVDTFNSSRLFTEWVKGRALT